MGFFMGGSVTCRFLPALSGERRETLGPCRRVFALLYLFILKSFPFFVFLSPLLGLYVLFRASLVEKYESIGDFYTMVFSIFQRVLIFSYFIALVLYLGFFMRRDSLTTSLVSLFLFYGTFENCSLF